MHIAYHYFNSVSCILQGRVEGDVESSPTRYVISQMKMISEDSQSGEFNLKKATTALYEQFKPDSCKLVKQSILSVHISRFHNGLKSCQCKLCEYSATQASNLKRHVDAVHKGLKAFQCNLCKFSTALADSIKNTLMQFTKD